MSAARICERCAKPLSETATENICPACIAQLARAPWLEETNSEAAIQTEAAASAKVETPSWEGPGRMIGRYKLLEKLGEGGCGVVYVAGQTEPVRRNVALKVIKAGMDTKQVVARFGAERQALAMMDHPNIAKVLDAGTTDAGRPYFVMELVRGIRITDYCDQANLSPKERLDLFIKVCQAIQHAHQKGIIHRDIKPSNILVTLHDGVPVPKVIDFGIAKATEGRLTDATVYTQLHQLIGTPAYMSPEQAEMSGLDIDTRTDIYSLGVVLYQLITGKTPFDAKILLSGGYDEIRRRIKEEEPPRPSTRVSTMEGEELTSHAKHRKLDPRRFAAELRGDLDWIVMKALEKDRTRRYDTANGFAQDLKRFLGNEPVIARPPSAAYRFQKLVRRNKLAFAAAGVLFVTLVLGIAASTWQAIRAKTEAQRATREAAHAQEARDGEAAQRARAEEGQRHEALLRRAAEAEAYAADMKACQVSLQQNNLGNGVRLLDRHRKGVRGEDLRGIEWRYLWQAARGDEIYTFQHPSMVSCARFSPDGKLMVSASFDGVLRVWDFQSRKLIAEVDRGVRDESARGSFCFSPDGRTLVSAHRNGIVVVDCASWQIVRTLELPSSEREWLRNDTSLIYSPNGRWLAAGLWKQGIRIWDTANWQTKLLPISTEGRIAFAPDSSAIALRRNGVELLDVSTGAKITDHFGLGDSIGLHFSPHGDWLAATTWGGRVEAVDLATNQKIFSVQAHPAAAFALAVSPDGTRLASGGHDQLIHIWDVATQQKLFTLRGHRSEVWSLDFSPDGSRWLISSSKDGTVKLWEPDRKRLPNEWGIEPTDMPLGFATNQARVVTLYAGRALRYWEQGEVVKTVPLQQRVFPPVIYEPHSGNLFVRGANSTVQVYNHDSGRVARSISVPYEWSRFDAVSPGGRWIAVRTERADGWALHLLDGFSGAEVMTFPDFQEGPYALAAFSPDNHFLAYGTTNFHVKVWDLKAQIASRTLTGHSWRTNPMDFSADGRFLATSSWDAEVRVWDMTTGKEVVAPLRGHHSGINAVRFARDSKTLVTSSDDNTVRFWHLATGREMLVLANRGMVTGDTRAGLLSPNGELLVTLDSGRVRVERIPTFQEIETAEIGGAAPRP